MSNPQSETTQKQTFSQRARGIWLGLIRPHASVEALGEFRRAQLLAILTLILSALIIGGIISRPKSIGIFLTLGGIALISYILSRTKFYRLGAYLFSYAFTAIGYISIYQGTATSVNSSVTSTVHIALIFSSALLSQGGFLSLAILSSIATFMAPYYSHTPVTQAESLRTGGVVLVIGAVLYGIQVYRANLEKESLKKVTDSNRELEEMTISLEQRIGARSIELEKATQQVQVRAARLQIISEISQEITSNVDQQPKELLNRIVRSVSEKLGFYHVGIFLLDENREFAVLRAANSDGGQRMLARRHQLKVGGIGIVGYVSQSGRPRIALDTGSDAVFFNNPDLPRTHSEIALPLKYGSTIIGVLDVQSTLPSAFNDEDTNLLSTLTNQIAIVISTILTSERAEFGSSSQKIIRRGEALKSRQLQSGYSYLPDGTISSATPASNSAVDQVVASGEALVLAQPARNIPATLIIPVKFRDQVIGVIHIESAEANRKWTEDEVEMVQAVSERAAFALENARLFEETSRRAEQEETIARVTTQIGASTDFNRILQTTIQELGQALGASRSFIQLGTPPENENKNTAE